MSESPEGIGGNRHEERRDHGWNPSADHGLKCWLILLRKPEPEDNPDEKTGYEEQRTGPEEGKCESSPLCSEGPIRSGRV